MNKIESLILGMFFGLLLLVFCLLAVVFGVGILFGTQVLGSWLLLSLVPGVIINVIFLKDWVRNAYFSTVTAGGKGLTAFHSCTFGPVQAHYCNVQEVYLTIQIKVSCRIGMKAVAACRGHVAGCNQHPARLSVV